MLIRQFRYACDAEVVEMPAGTRSDQDDASLEQVTRMELQQELGATCGEVQTIADYFESPAHNTQHSTAVIAWETAVTGAPQREPGEDIQMWTLPAEELPMRRFSDALKAAVDGVLDAHVGQIAPSTSTDVLM